MTTTDVFEATLFVALFVFAILVLFSLVGMRWRKYRGQTWREYGPRLLRYVGIRLSIAIAIAGAFCIILAAALTLNTHRPPADTNPVIRVSGASGEVKVLLEVEECGDSAEGTISVLSPGRRTPAASVYTDQGGLRQIAINGRGKGTFRLEEPTAKRGLLSCYLELPDVNGTPGPTRVSLRLGEDQEIDTLASIPAPDNYDGGTWQWRCAAGESCPALATFGSEEEAGTKQVIVLILAALFGSIIAIFIAEILLDPIRKRLARIAPEDPE